MPTMCSTCGRTSGKCESCRKVDAILTPERIDEIHDAALKKWEPASRTFYEEFARAISREVVAILAEDQRELVEALQTFVECPFLIDEATVSKSLGLEGTMARAPNQVVVNMSVGLARIRNAKAIIAKYSTPAASGIGESGGE